MSRSTVAALLRSTQAYCLHLCGMETLDQGIAFGSERFATLPEANQFREVVLGDPTAIPLCFEQAEQWFRSRDLYCYRWAAAGGRAPDELASFLMDRGFRPQAETAMVLTQWKSMEPAPDVRVLPARAMRDAFRATVRPPSAVISAETAESIVEAHEQRLDDPQYDMFVAMVDQQPAGRCALYQVGDLARVMDLSVREPFSSGRVERALLAQVLALAKRLTMRHVYVQSARGDRKRRALYEDAGFVADGEIIEYERDRAGDSDY